MLKFLYTDRGALLYPTVEFVSRLWTVYLFVKETLPKISSSTSILQGLVEFLLPHMEKCSTFVCEIARPGENNKELIDVILRKFLKPILSNKRKLHLCLNKKSNSFDPANKERRARTLRQ